MTIARSIPSMQEGTRSHGTPISARNIHLPGLTRDEGFYDDSSPG